MLNFSTIFHQENFLVRLSITPDKPLKNVLRYWTQKYCIASQSVLQYKGPRIGTCCQIFSDSENNFMQVKDRIKCLFYVLVCCGNVRDKLTVDFSVQMIVEEV